VNHKTVKENLEIEDNYYKIDNETLIYKFKSLKFKIDTRPYHQAKMKV
jgi:hypothetical protein